MCVNSWIEKSSPTGHQLHTTVAGRAHANTKAPQPFVLLTWHLCVLSSGLPVFKHRLTKSSLFVAWPTYKPVCAGTTPFLWPVESPAQPRDVRARSGGECVCEDKV